MSEQTIDLRDFEMFRVIKVDTAEKYGYQIVAGDTDYPIFGLGNRGHTEQELERIKAFLDYWCLHLNQAYMAGYVRKDGFVLQHTEATVKRLDDLYQKAYGPQK